MIFEISAGAIIFRRQKNKIKYLLLKHSEKYWNFPKGHIEKGESELMAAKREVWEETGIKKMEILTGFKGEEKYYYRLAKDLTRVSRRHKKIFKTVFFYLAQVRVGQVKISREHQDFAWCEFDEAMRKLRYQASKDIFKKADKFLHDYFSKQSLRHR